MTGQSLPPDDARRRRHRNERIAATVLVLLVSAAAAAVVLWRRAEEAEYARLRTYIPKPARITPEVELLAEYVRIDTSTPAGSAEGARWLARQLAKHGIRAELIESAPGRLNVYARLRGRRPGEGLLLLNHVDVVPAGGGWQPPPYEAKVVANQMWGRGTLDMKALAICQLLAFVDEAKSGRPPEHDLVFLATADEETGSAYGMKWIVEHRRDVIDGVRYAITEGGVTEMLTETMTYFGIEIGGKQLVEATLYGDDRESIERTRIALEPYIGARRPDRVLPAVRTYFREIAPTRLRFRSLLTDIDATIRQGAFWLLPVSYRDLTQNSLWVSGPHRSGDGWGLNVKMSNLPDEDPDARLAWLERQVAPHGVKISAVPVKNGPGPLSPSDTPLFRMLVDEARERYRVQAGTQILFRSTSDARFLRPLGIACYGVSPYPVDIYQSLTIHAANERIRIDYFNDGVEYLRNVVRRWAARGR